jgi:hypothetical protein
MSIVLGLARCDEMRALFEVFRHLYIYINDPFTKTGSGQQKESTQKRDDAFSRLPMPIRSRSVAGVRGMPCEKRHC